ncbi:hypothetical protein ESA94_17855 [Lacibacter luteus]|uniref:Uncharacterized protein n=1 Tax=Lacibacter luteus TaxID=2508719 RepID=A0A4Q1CFQ7_9BACT|nr:hypothetical protein [Lacibacter luteus]RXK58502.1 hypothetical protein ESA94_17855 [Lacibacter luteus]
MNISNNRMVVDITDQNITLGARSFFVAIQWLSVAPAIDYNQPQISFTRNEKESLTRLRGDEKNNFQWYIPQPAKVFGNMLVCAEIIVRE